MNKIPLSVFFCVFLFALTSNCACEADPLEEILPKLNQIKPNRRDNLRDSEKWFIAGSNYSKIFDKITYTENLILGWLGDLVVSEFAMQSKKAKISEEFVSLSAEYSVINSPKNQISLLFLAPHPKYLDLVDNRLLPQFADLEPPNLEVKDFQKIEIQGHTCFQYRHKNNDCSLLFKLPKSAVLNIQSKNCVDFKSVSRFAALLDITRLTQKILS